jgi:hypothetical protein
MGLAARPIRSLTGGLIRPFSHSQQLALAGPNHGGYTTQMQLWRVNDFVIAHSHASPVETCLRSARGVGRLSAVDKPSADATRAIT